MTVKRLDEATNPRYIKTPPITQQTYADGEPLDAGTAMILTNNINHLSIESCKNLFNCLQPNIDISGNQEGGYYAGFPVKEVSTNTVLQEEQPHTLISWGENTALRFGPFLSPFDGRKLLVKLGIFNGNQTDVLVYITRNAAPPTESNNSLLYSKTTLVDVEDYELSITLEPSRLWNVSNLLTSLDRFPTDTQGSYATNYIQKKVYWVWLGLRTTSKNTSLAYVSGMEIR